MNLPSWLVLMLPRLGFKGLAEAVLLGGMLAEGTMTVSTPINERQGHRPLDPASLVQLPRPTEYFPDPSNQLAFTTLSTYQHANRSKTTSLAIVDLNQNYSSHHTILEKLDYSEAVWLDPRTILYLRNQTNGNPQPNTNPASTIANYQHQQCPKPANEPSDQQPSGVELWAVRITEKLDHQNHSYRIGHLPIQIENLKFQTFPLSGGSSGVLGFTAQVYPPYDSNSFENFHSIQKKLQSSSEGSTGQTYDSIFVRHWDQWLDQHGKDNRLFVLDLDRKGDLWSLLDPGKSPRSLFPDFSVPVGPLGSGSDFDLSPSSAIVTTKDPNVNPAWHTRQNIYITSLYPRTQSNQKPLQLTTGDQGATSNPVFSPSAKTTEQYEIGFVAWLEMKQDGYESDQNQLVVYNLETRKRIYYAKSWDRSPSKIVWGKDDSELYLLAQERGQVKVFYLSLESSSEPVKLTDENAVSHVAYLGHPSSKDVKNLGEARLLLTVSSLTYGPTAQLLTIDHHHPSSPPISTKPSVLASIDKFQDYSLHPGLDFWFEGAQSKLVHGILVRPPGFIPDQNQKWPLLFLIHGGPQGAWENGWSIRWNANTFASAGYLVAMINPTGSTGYGQEFTDAINQDWGGKPYQDLVSGYVYLLKTFPEIDRSRTAALGASYGGYMVNWMMGHNQSPLNFKAFVSHDGIFNTLSSYYATDELYFPEHDHGGTPSDKREEYERWNPANFVKNWKTPCLVIHSRKDYRLPESEGLSVFNVLQRQGVPSRLLYFPDENHWVLSPANSIRWYNEIFRFLAEWCPPGDQSKAGTNQSHDHNN